jgi:hypothetical protein
MKTVSPPALFRTGFKCPLDNSQTEGTRLVFDDYRLTILVYRRHVDPSMALIFSRGTLYHRLTYFRNCPVLVHTWPQNNVRLVTAVSSSHLPTEALLGWVASRNHFIQLFLVDIRTNFIRSSRIYHMSREMRGQLVASIATQYIGS